MAVSPFIAAKKLCLFSDWTISNLKLQKLLYMAHMVHMGRHDGNELITGELFEAWDYGPVLPSLYHKTKIFGSDPIKNIFRSVPDMEEDEGSETIEEIWDRFGDITPGKLIAISHWEDGAWAHNYDPGSRGKVITNSEILAEYNRRVHA